MNRFIRQSLRQLSARSKPSLVNGQIALSCKMCSTASTQSLDKFEHLLETFRMRDAPKNQVKPSDIELFKSLPDETYEKLMEPSVSMWHLNFRSVVNCVHFLHSVMFPLPEQLTKEQWDKLLSLTNQMSRTKYLEAIAENNLEGNANFLTDLI